MSIMDHVLRCSGYELIIKDIIQAKDCYLYDSDNKRFTDFEAGVWCTVIGHNHERINQAIRTQIEKISHVGYRYTCDLIEEAALEVLSTVFLPEGKCIFLSSGSESVEFGVQLTRCLTGKPLLLSLSDSYLGAYGSASKKRKDEWYGFDWRECTPCLHQDECDPDCPHIKNIPFDRIGGFVFEPGNSSGLVRFPPKPPIKFFTTTIQQNQGLVIVDEVTTGLGRTGAWFGFQHYNINPDIIIMGKGLGNGYPVSSVVLTQDVADRLEKSDFQYAQSHQNDPLGCAIAREVIKVIREDDLVKQSKKTGFLFLHELKRLEIQYGIIKEIRGRGLMLAMEFRSDYERFSLNSVFDELIKKGFIVGYKPQANLFRFYPALTIKEKDIDLFLLNLNQILKYI